MNYQYTNLFCKLELDPTFQFQLLLRLIACEADVYFEYHSLDLEYYIQTVYQVENQDNNDFSNQQQNANNDELNPEIFVCPIKPNKSFMTQNTPLITKRLNEMNINLNEWYNTSLMTAVILMISDPIFFYHIRQYCDMLNSYWFYIWLYFKQHFVPHQHFYRMISFQLF